MGHRGGQPQRLQEGSDGLRVFHHRYQAQAPVALRAGGSTSIPNARCSARMAATCKDTPVDTAIVGIVDTMKLDRG